MRTMLALAILAIPLAFATPAAFAAPGDDNHPDYPGPWRYSPPGAQGQPANVGTVAGASQPTSVSLTTRDSRGEGRNR